VIGRTCTSRPPSAGAGLATGFSPNPLLGLDHLLLLVGVGASASFIQLNAVALCLGSRLRWAPCFGLSGGQLPLAELVAALAVSLPRLLILRSRRQAAPRRHRSRAWW